VVSSHHMDECILHDNKRCDFHYLDELAEWIENRLKKMRQLAAEQSTSSESDVDEEEMSEGKCDGHANKMCIVTRN